MHFKKIALASAITGVLAGCGADDQSYDYVDKPENLISKSDIKTDQVYLYMPSMAEAPKYSVSMAPFMQGQEKLVTLEFEGDLTSDSGGRLQVRMINDDIISQDEIDQEKLGRWLENQSLAKPVLTIPVDYVDYQCRENDYGECTNKEEQVDKNDVAWYDRRFIVPDFEGITVSEFTWNDIYTYASGCYTQVGGKKLANDDWAGYEVTEDGVINFEVETTYRVANNWRCMIVGLIQNDFDPDNLSFTVSNFYSLVPLDMVRSPDYEPIVYMKGDEDLFGFFANEKGRPGLDYVDGEFDQNFEYMHRFSPNKAYVDYHLSDSFDLNEETLFFKRVTEDVVDLINPQLAKTGAPQIKLHEPSGKQSGDLRYNVINLIDEPLRNGLAGYGPSAVNPLTGEIVHAHVNQYSGVLRSISYWLWDRIVTDYNAGRVDPIVGSTPEVAPAASFDAFVLDSVDEHGHHQHGDVAHVDHLHVEGEYVNEQRIVAEGHEVEHLEDILKAIEEEMLNDGEEVTIAQISSIQRLEERLWAENNMYPVTALRGGSSFKSLPTEIGGMTFDYNQPELWVDGQVGDGKLKKFSELSEATQAELSLFLAGVYYAKTLVHEFGHNFGLRHNFQGSNDSDNYFTDEELADYGLENAPGYSSIMDYNPSMLNALAVFGPYDLAALRFGYKRELEVNVSLSDTAPDGTPEIPSSHTDLQDGFVSLDQYDVQLREETLDPLTRPSDLVYDGVIGAIQTAVIDEVEALDDYNAALRDYKFCTDGNVTLNEDCNRHDEGRNRAEIMEYKLESYDDLFYKRTIRGMRANFSESTISSYAIRRVREFADWRNSIHDFERWKEFLSPAFQNDPQRFFTSKTDPFCMDEANMTGITWELYCGSPRALDQARDKLINILVTPEHTCEVEDGNGVVSYQKLATIIDEWDYRNNFPINHVPESCFDEGVVASLAGAGFVVTGEVGKYLNSGKAPRPAPVNNYSNYIDYVGSWGDKLAAAATLVDRIGYRQSTDRSTVALIDLVDLDFRPDGTFVTEPRVTLLNSLILGYEYASLTQPFTDAEGNQYAARGDFTPITWDDTMEAMPYYGSYSVRNYFKIPRFQEVPLNKAILTAMVEHSAGYMVDQRDEVLARSISMRSELPVVQAVRSFQRSNGATYFATEENSYAWDMIEFVTEYQTMLQAEAAQVDLTTVPVNSFSLAQFQDANGRALLQQWFEYQLNSLENLPIYNNVRDLTSDLLSH